MREKNNAIYFPPNLVPRCVPGSLNIHQWPPHLAFIGIKQSHLLIPCILLKSTSTSPTHIQILSNGGVLVIWNQWQARTESPREGGPLYLGPLPNQCSLGPCCAAYPKHCCIAHITSVCFCVLSLKIACLWAESAPNFNICFEPTSAHSSCRQSCFAWNLVKSEQARRKCFFPRPCWHSLVSL